MVNKKTVLITIVVLLFLFTPLTIISSLVRKGENPLEENSSHQFFYKGYLWFYDENDKFLSKYECGTEICEYTKPIIDDNTYGLNYYLDGNITLENINNHFAFITDGAIINLINIETGTVLQKYKAIKNYNTNLANDIFIIQNTEGVWGVLSLGNNIRMVIPFEYDFLGLANKINDKTLNTDKFIGLKDSKWVLIDNNNSALSSYFEEPIIDYNNNYIITKNDNEINFYSYQGTKYLENYQIKNYILEDKYIGVIVDNLLLIYDDFITSPIKTITLNNTDNVKLEVKDNILNIIVDNEIIDTIA